MDKDKPAILRLEGPLTMTTVGQRLNDGRTLAMQGDLRVDFSGLSATDSVALALLFEWLRTARRYGNRLEVCGLADGLRSLAELYGVLELLPTQVAGPEC